MLVCRLIVDLGVQTNELNCYLLICSPCAVSWCVDNRI